MSCLSAVGAVLGECEVLDEADVAAARRRVRRRSPTSPASTKPASHGRTGCMINPPEL